MFDNLEKAIKATKDSVGRIIIVTVASALIVLTIQVALARFGIHVVPPQPVQVEIKQTQKAPKKAHKKAAKKAPKK